MPAMPIALSSAPIVVGMRQTRSETRITTLTDAPGEARERLTSDDDDRQEHDGEDREQDREGDLVRRLLAVRSFDEGDHPVEERLAALRGDLDDDAVRQHRRAAGDCGAVTAGLADHRARTRR